MLWRWILVLWLAGCGIIQAQPLVVLERQSGAIALDGRMDWLRDAGAQWTPEDAAAATGWQRLPSSPNAGFTKDAIWLRFTVQKPDDDRSWRLQVDNALIEYVDLYRRGAGGHWEGQHAGRAQLHSQWPLDTRSPVFALELPVGEHTFLLRLATRNSLSTSVRLWEAERFYAGAQHEALLWGFYFGLYGLVILIQFLFWYWTREPLSGWYVLYAGLNCFSMLMTMGYLQNALDWSARYAIPALSLSICVSIYIGTQFTVVVLDLRRYMPRLHQFLVRGATAASITTSVMVLAGFMGPGTVSAQLVSIVWMLVLFWATVVMLVRRGDMAERFLLLAFTVFFLGILIRYLRNLSILSAGPLTDYSVQVGSVVHMIVMCVFIAYRYNALRIALQVEKTARQEQRDFVALVSHEFRTPLAIIDTSAQQLATHLDAPAEKSRKRCANIQAATRRMTNLMDNYLTVERMGNYEQAMQTRPSDIDALLADVAAEWPEGRVSLRANPLPANFVCDPDMLRVALRNLISNADRHAAPGTIIELVARHLRNTLHLRVTNTGEPIPRDELPHLFQKYHRGRAARGRPGAGLGLFLVHQIVQAHGGRITVKSASGRTSFKIWLPQAEETARDST